MTDWELLTRYISGDKSAIDTLIRRHIDTVYATARRAAHSPADADDITQAVFLLLTRKAAHISQRGTLIGWLYRATRFCAANLNKQERRRRQHEEAAMQPPPTPATEPTEALALLDRALQRLPDPERAALLLHHLSQKSYPETAAALGISPEAARKRADRALEKIRAYFSAHGHAASSTLPALLAAAHLPAPAATLHSALALAAGATAPARIALLLKRPLLTAKLLIPLAAVLALLPALALFHHAPITPPTTPAATPIILTAGTEPATDPTLPPLELLAADPDHPTAPEVKTFLKARLARLSNLSLRYTVHTSYPAPAKGWPTLPPHLPEDSPPETLLIGPAALIEAVASQPNAPSLLFLFPTGSSDADKSFSQLDGRLRYERTVTATNRLIPFPDSVREFSSKIYTFHDGVIDRLFTDQFGQSTAASNPRAALPELDIEPALLLAGYRYRIGTFGSGLPPASIFLNPADIDAMTITFPDPRHILLTHSLVPTRAANTRPASTTRPANPFFSAQEQWTLDRDQHYAPIHYENPSAGPIDMTLSDFHPIAGLMIPRKIAIHYSIGNPESAQPIRTDTLLVTDCKIQDPANTPDRYTIHWPDGLEPRRPNPAARRNVQVSDMEIYVGADTVDSTALTHLNSTFSHAGSPSTPASRDTAPFHAAHDAFLKRAQQGHIDTLLIGDDYAAHWSDDPNVWKQLGDPTRTANFALTGDRVEHVLWCITHGELDHLAPTTILLLAGNRDAAYASDIPRAAPVSFNSYTYGTGVNWLPRSDPPEKIAAGIANLAQTLHEKCPAAKILILSLATYPARSAADNTPEHIAAINELLATLTNPAKNIRFVDLTPMTPAASSPSSPPLFDPHHLPTPALYARWTTTLLKFMTP